MLLGHVQHDFPLTTQHALRRMRTLHRHSELVYAPAGEEPIRATYEEVAERIDRFAAALVRLGVKPSDRVGTLMWNRPEHWWAYFAIPGIGAVIHTLNLRLSNEQLIYIVNHAQDRVILVQDSLVPQLEEIAPKLKTVEHFVIVGDGDAGSLAPASRLSDLMAAEEPGFKYPAIPDDRQASFLVYTSGTTGYPKGVLLSHRSNVLGATMLLTADNFAIRESDKILQTSPLFHAIGWALPYAAALSGASVVLPGRDVSVPRICQLIERERITMTGAVPTVLLDLLRHADEHKPDLSSLRFVLSGASAVPPSLLRALRERHGVNIGQAWGMTELGPSGGIAWPPPHAEGEGEWHYRYKSARFFPLTEYRIVDEDGNDLPWDGETTGELLIRSPFAISGYYRNPEADAECFLDGWLRTGDIATIDELGYVQITDRLKDVIKSGGEWISSVDLENRLMAHPDVQEAAVIAMPHERWAERPLACLVLRPGAEATPDDLRAWLSDQVSRIALPDAFAYLPEVPKTGAGKFDKKLLRQRLAEGKLELRYPSEKQPDGAKV